MINTIIKAKNQYEYYKKKASILQYIVVILAINLINLIQLAFYESFINKQFIHAFKLFPISIFYAILMVLTHKFRKISNKKLYKIIILTFLISSLVFYLLYFAILHSSFDLKFKKVNNCEILGEKRISLSKSEKYFAYYIQFTTEDSQENIGYGCFSDVKKNSVFNISNPPFYFERLSKERVIYYQQLRQLEQVNSLLPIFNKNMQQDNQIQQIDNNRNLVQLNITEQYKITKLAPWVCISDYQVVEELLSGKDKSCYMAQYGGEFNSKNKQFSVENTRFPLISFDSELYYDQTFFYLIITLSLYPSLNTQTWIILDLLCYIILVVKHLIIRIQKKGVINAPTLPQQILSQKQMTIQSFIEKTPSKQESDQLKTVKSVQQIKSEELNKSIYLQIETNRINKITVEKSDDFDNFEQTKDLQIKPALKVNQEQQKEIQLSQRKQIQFSNQFKTKANRKDEDQKIINLNNKSKSISTLPQKPVKGKLLASTMASLPSKSTIRFQSSTSISEKKNDFIYKNNRRQMSSSDEEKLDGLYHYIKNLEFPNHMLKPEYQYKNDELQQDDHYIDKKPYKPIRK